MTNSKRTILATLMIGILTIHSGCDQSTDSTASKTNQDPVQTKFDPALKDTSTDKVLDELLDEVDNQPDLKDVEPETGTTDLEQANSQEPQNSQEPELTEEEREREFDKPTIEVGDNWTRLSEKKEVWIDKKAKQVMFTGRVCLNAGQLEMFICPEHTKEHESIIASRALAKEVHMALLLVDCKPGKTASWNPDYTPAHGPTIDATLKWRDKKTGKTKTQNGKEWIRDLNTNGPMTQKWIFGGSEFWKDPDTGVNHYYGDSGELLCLSNFSTATIDVGVESSNANAGLLFEAFTENIAPEGTKVYVILTPGPAVAPAKKAKKQKPEKKAEVKDEKAAKETAAEEKTIDEKASDKSASEEDASEDKSKN